ncbi:putative protein EXORDIUM [Helianthus annuus]|nr:putative protein EXORDIUM [Helianthus annuus]
MQIPLFYISIHRGVHLALSMGGKFGKDCPGLCAYPFVVPDFARGAVKPLKSPNGEVGVDTMISVIAHEMAEMATDPLVNAWYASSDPADPVEITDVTTLTKPGIRTT